ncbi:glycosyl transferase [Leptospira idonii]|uniref:Glycosyl transferase n=1 Tax=Leptospira idonii TaxID=1193500 RepID=A0A4R9M247_9LEPT|nr:glycosyl transferase [Leptospira idonii]TGN19925.1 glycosyl transferase [Leptospira idonii]
MKIYYYASGHGFGHISRTSVILETMLKDPRLTELHLVSDRISFVEWDHPKLIKRTGRMDVGVYQKDSLSLDVGKTKSELIEFEKNKSALLREETKYCKEKGIKLIVTDAGSFPITIALEAGIPSVFIGNFTWDFIYQNYGKIDSYFSGIAEILRTEYSFATEALYLPFTCPMPPFLESSNVGLVGRKPRLTKEQAKESFGWKPDKKYILISFGAYGLEGFSFQWDKLDPNIQIVAYGVPGLVSDRVFTPAHCYYPDLVTASDYVLTKPGYGILSECYYAKTPILYTDRGDFSEYPYLVKSLEKYFPSAYISHEEISNCSFESAISSIDREEKEVKVSKVSENGDLEISERIFEYT